MESSAHAKLKATRETLVDAHSTQYRALEALLSQEKVERDQLIQTAKLREDQMLEQMQQAVKDAKARVYEKAKLQFETGNKEYTKLKQQYKSMSAEKDTVTADLDKACTEVSSLRVELQELQTAGAGRETKLAQISSAFQDLTEVVLALLGPSEAVLATAGDDRVQLAKASVGLHHRQFNELTSEKDALAKRMRELELQQELKDSSAGTLSKRIQALETEIASAGDTRKGLEQELEELRKERDAQMIVVARLMVDKAKASCDGSCSEIITTLRKSNEELEERCGGLRAMNEEVLGMLEKFQGLS